MKGMVETRGTKYEQQETTARRDMKKPETLLDWLLHRRSVFKKLPYGFEKE
jgi:hypothetical protein